MEKQYEECMNRKYYDIKVIVDGIVRPCVDILSDNLCLTYAGTPSAHGLQSNFEDGSMEYKRQMELCDKISDCMRELVAMQEEYQSHIDENKEL